MDAKGSMAVTSTCPSYLHPLHFAAYFFPQQHPDLSSGLAPAGVDRNFCRQGSLQK
jgi:hypothetical protein